MMTWSDDTLMAFVDGELDVQQRAELEQALRSDAALRQRVEALAQQRSRVAAAFAPVLAEPVPDRLASLLQAPVVSLGEVRAARQQRQRLAARAPTWLQSWQQWGGMAAAVLLGVVLGTQLNPPGADPALVLREGQLVAEGAVAQALASQLASEPVAGAPVAVQLSFVDRGGSYCRTFSTAAVAGLACRQGAQWTLQSLAAADRVPEGAVRQAATSLPRAVLDAVDQRISGDALDPGRERQARDQGWRAPAQ